MSEIKPLYYLVLIVDDKTWWIFETLQGKVLLVAASQFIHDYGVLCYGVILVVP